ncbi:acetyl-CoA C-acetyltransferase [Thermosporothrix hazakensis]|jgi:acetyl-CoA C-acetyltransferase|uniref:acetyl-CoA C-acetyltransferase n=2 Tax=Thermosporothrix TaxID=768650 RepID=A0A326UFW5_THEHA|nr:acetyl-CoA C-acetyltransferase [Thermosporothrix hazakensis]PZW36795.1 acetyl-CoA C-acetyltransferase [Thermosporothrix hazakensis]BBH89261.1 acetyl-CoA acetyltransferase [Thermosporothrix sp. COM3]GCE47444.1 acetyl-CoA acetyltransferase [Thermosporothrix hazakensis]
MTEHIPVLVGAARTPTGKFLGSLASLSAIDLGAIAIKEAVRRAGIDPASLDEVIMGNVVSAGLGQAPARQAAIHAGLPEDLPAFTINKVCGSGLKAVMLAAQAIRAGDGQAFVAGGMESMSNAPYLLPKARTGYRMGDGKLIDAVVHDGLWCAFEDIHMGNEAEIIAEKFGISREAQDQFALSSHQKALAATQAGRFKDEIIPIEIKQKKGTIVVDTDEPIRGDTSAEALAKLKPAFLEGGTVTAGNAPGLSDGASATVVVDEAFAKAHGLNVLARITGYASAAITPRYIFAAPTRAVRRVLERTGLEINDFDLIEVNEAFAAQTLANGKELDWDWSRVNVNGGAIALGHPIGSSGSRVLTTLIYELRRRGGGRGLATLCLGGGGAVAMTVEV